VFSEIIVSDDLFEDLVHTQCLLNSSCYYEVPKRVVGITNVMRDLGDRSLKPAFWKLDRV
jgi:hypothetical protein